MIGYGYRRHVCDDEESHHDEGDHVQEDHNDHCSEDCFVMFSLSDREITAFFGLFGVAASSLVGLYDLVLVSAVSPLWRRSDVRNS